MVTEIGQYVIIFCEKIAYLPFASGSGGQKIHPETPK